MKGRFAFIVSWEGQKRLVELLLLAGLLVGVWYGWQYVYALRVQLLTEEGRLSALPEYSARLTTLRKDVVTYQDDIANIEALLVPRNDIVSFVDELETQAVQHGVQLAITDIVEVTQGESEDAAAREIAKIQLSLDVTGEPQQLLHFLHRVEYGRGVGQVVTLRLTQQPVAAVEVPGSVTQTQTQTVPGSVPGGDSEVAVDTASGVASPYRLAVELVVAVQSEE